MQCPPVGGGIFEGHEKHSEKRGGEFMKKAWDVNVNGVMHTVEYRAGFGAKVIVLTQKSRRDAAMRMV